MKTISTPAHVGVQLTRRRFVRSATAGVAATAVTFGPKSAWSQAPSDQLNVAVIGAGSQGQALLNAMKDSLIMTNQIRLAAIVDLWDYKRKATTNSFKRQVSKEIADYATLDELLSKETALDAVFVATPDFLHAPMTVQLLKAGKHVYCEKMMSNELEAARSMVLAQQETGKLCQIGHQRHSNPRYIRVRNEIIGTQNPTGKSLLGQITCAYAQWNRAVTKPISANAKVAIPDDVLKANGYESWEEFLNWRWYKKYGGGPISDLGAHQIDMFNWMLGALPTSVVVSGGVDYYDGSGEGDQKRMKFEHYDSVQAIYEYNVNGKTVRAMYGVQTTTSSQGIYEKFMGDAGSVAINEQGSVNDVYRENYSFWGDPAVEAQIFKTGVIGPSASAIHHKFWESAKPFWRPDPWLYKEGFVDARESAPAGAFSLKTVLNKPYHTPHIENFIDVVKKGGKQSELNCTVQDAFATTVTVLRLNEAIANGTNKHVFDPKEFIA